MKVGRLHFDRARMGRPHWETGGPFAPAIPFFGDPNDFSSSS